MTVEKTTGHAKRTSRRSVGAFVDTVGTTDGGCIKLRAASDEHTSATRVQLVSQHLLAALHRLQIAQRRRQVNATCSKLLKQQAELQLYYNMQIRKQRDFRLRKHLTTDYERKKRADAKELTS